MPTARLLHQAFGQSPQYWLNLDTNYRLRLQTNTETEDAVAIRANIYEHMPVKEMVRKGWLEQWNTVKELAKEVKQFWQINKLDFGFLDKHPLPIMRKSEAFSQNKYHTLAWFQMAKHCATRYKVSGYNKTTLEQLAETLHTYTITQQGVGLFLKQLNQAGVKFFVLSHLPKTYMDGASFYDGEYPAIVYTKRYDRIDNFWFTIAHEITHILRHFERKEDCFIDNIENLDEPEADQSASQLLKAKEIERYLAPCGSRIARRKVAECAEKLKVHPGIVVGILQHYNKLPRRNLNSFKIKVSGLIPAEYYAEE